MYCLSLKTSLDMPKPLTLKKNAEFVYKRMTVNLSQVSRLS